MLRLEIVVLIIVMKLQRLAVSLALVRMSRAEGLRISSIPRAAATASIYFPFLSIK